MFTFNVAFVINKNYLGQFKVTFNSLANSNPEKSFSVHLLHSDLGEEERADLERFVGERGGAITFYSIDSSVFSGLPKMGYDTAYTAYNKVLIPYYLENCGKVLFLDCDIVVRGDVAPLFEERGAFLSAVPDFKINKKRKEHVELITGDPNNIYFNSGVMVFDFSKKEQMEEKDEVIAYIGENSGIIRWHDQDILNHFYASNYAVLEEKYNYITTFKSVWDGIFRAGGGKAVIVHYANWKPWNENYIGKQYKLYKKNYNALKGERGVDFLKKRKLSAQLKLIFKYLKRG